MSALRQEKREQARRTPNAAAKLVHRCKIPRDAFGVRPGLPALLHPLTTDYYDFRLMKFSLQLGKFNFALGSGRSEASDASTVQRSNSAMNSSAVWLGGGNSSYACGLSSPHEQSVWVYTAVSSLAQTISAIPFRISRGDRSGEHLVGNGPVIELENSIIPLCARLEAAVQPIVKSFGSDLVGWFDTDSIPVMQQARRNRVDTAVKLFALGYPANAINKALDLRLPHLSWGNKGYLPLGLQQAGEMIEPAPASEPETRQPEPPDPEPGAATAAIDRMLELLRRMRDTPRGVDRIRRALHKLSNPQPTAAIKDNPDEDSTEGRTTEVQPKK